MFEEMSQQEVGLEVLGYQQWLNEQTPEVRERHLNRFNSIMEQRNEFEALGYRQWFEALTLEGQRRHIDELESIMDVNSGEIS